MLNPISAPSRLAVLHVAMGDGEDPGKISNLTGVQVCIDLGLVAVCDEGGGLREGGARGNHVGVASSASA